jgi:hypothetical protein
MTYLLKIILLCTGIEPEIPSEHKLLKDDESISSYNTGQTLPMSTGSGLS